MNKIIELLLSIIENTEGLCLNEYRECKHVLRYVDKSGVLVGKTVYYPNTKEMDEIINNALVSLEKECKFGIPNK